MCVDDRSPKAGARRTPKHAPRNGGSLAIPAPGAEPRLRERRGWLSSWSSQPEPEPEPEPALRRRSQQQLAGAGLRVLLLHDAVLLLCFFLPERHFAYALC